MTDSLSIQQARKLVLLSQQLPPSKQTGNSVDATRSAIEQIGYIQIDTISVIQRAHHHTLWNRNPRYQADQLDQLLADRSVYEYWSHAAAYLPMRDYRFSLPRKQAFKSGKQKHFYQPDKRLMKQVLQRITDEGPLMAKDFDHTGKRTKDWQSKPAKRALESLFMQGDLMIPRRVNFHKVYDLTERVLPNHTDTTVPTPHEYARFLITRYLQANGLGQCSEIAYLLKNTKPIVADALKQMSSSGELREVRVADELYYTLPDSIEQLSKPLLRSKLKILSPFDNLLIQRKRMQKLFDFDYLIECYVPAAKRKYGYFSLPILWDGRLVARMDCKANRDTCRLDIHHLSMEPGIEKNDAFFDALRKELKSFLRFNDCRALHLKKTSPAKLKPALKKALNHLAD
ncbi:winged helix-turn-helix domain-containing protein [Planctomycetes bacterium K23_9]|uniref:Winged helix DNA-binding domain-containing protein n=1 Tax=Stieleria marina TaxID=1930275 RepID=A0A517NTV8_9BACT|nr:hypothetical protein K239x_25150 [Planctomycetes bacterium K23_9]